MEKEEKRLTGGSVIGEFTDTITYADGTKEVKEGQNLIVNDIGKLIACLFKKQDDYTGLSYWAIGSGQDAWDGKDVNATVLDSRLEAEHYRKEIPKENIQFLDEFGEPTEEITNRIGITLTFATNEANGKWREFSIFGGNATESPNTGLMINHKIHKILTKDESMTIERQIRFTFN